MSDDRIAADELTVEIGNTHAHICMSYILRTVPQRRANGPERFTDVSKDLPLFCARIANLDIAALVVGRSSGKHYRCPGGWKHAQNPAIPLLKKRGLSRLLGQF